MPAVSPVSDPNSLHAQTTTPFNFHFHYTQQHEQRKPNPHYLPSAVPGLCFCSARIPSVVHDSQPAVEPWGLGWGCTVGYHSAHTQHHTTIHTHTHVHTHTHAHTHTHTQIEYMYRRGEGQYLMINLRMLLCVLMLLLLGRGMTYTPRAHLRKGTLRPHYYYIII